jgi:hypothetical protein
MSANNDMYQFYKEMILGNKIGKDGNGLFEHAVCSWLSMRPENPFPEGTDAYEHFFRMSNYYNVWKLGGTGERFSMRRMFSAARDLCATKTKNPYKYDRKAAEEEKAILKEDSMKEQEKQIAAAEEANRLKAEHEEEVRKIMEELNARDVENEERIAAIQSAIEEANTKHQTKKDAAKEKVEKFYVFNEVEQQNKEKKSILKRLFKH